MKSRTSIIILFVLLTYSCTVYQHVPSPLNVPVLDKKDQLQVNIGGDNNKGFLQLNYSLSNAMYLFGEGFYYKSKNSGWLDILTNKDGGEVDSYKSQISQFKLGLGYYQNNDNLFINFQAGTGLGNLEYEHGRDESINGINYYYTLHTRNLELFLQPAVGFRMESYFDISIALRLRQESYFGVRQIREGDMDHYGDSYDYIFYRPVTNFQFMEPALTCRLGFKTVKLQLQGFRSFCLQGETLKYKKGSMNFQLGISYFFGNKQSDSSL